MYIFLHTAIYALEALGRIYGACGDNRPRATDIIDIIDIIGTIDIIVILLCFSFYMFTIFSLFS